MLFWNKSNKITQMHKPMCTLGPVLVFMYFTGYCKLGLPHSVHPTRYNIISVLQSFPVHTQPDEPFSFHNKLPEWWLPPENSTWYWKCLILQEELKELQPSFPHQNKSKSRWMMYVMYSNCNYKMNQLSIKWEEHSSTWISQDIFGSHLEARVQITW